MSRRGKEAIERKKDRLKHKNIRVAGSRWAAVCSMRHQQPCKRLLVFFVTLKCLPFFLRLSAHEQREEEVTRKKIQSQ